MNIFCLCPHIGEREREREGEERGREKEREKRERGWREVGREREIDEGKSAPESK